MNDYSVSDYSIFSNASSTTKELVTKYELEFLLENINEIRLRKRGALSVTIGITNLFLYFFGSIFTN